MSESKSMILGCSGPVLTADEKAFFADERPWAFIVFARNVVDRNQLSDLCASLRETVGRQDALVFVDQEGGRVQRLRPPLAPRYPTATRLGLLEEEREGSGARAAWLMGRLHAFDLRRCGLTANCIPCLDLPPERGAGFVGDRTFSSRREHVEALGKAMAEGSIAGGVLPVMKHIPGHGRAYADSHLELPRVSASLEELRASDFAPFFFLTTTVPMAMTAHVVYDAIDPSGPATTSATVINDIIRHDILFDGLLMSDDLSMKALSGDFASRTSASLEAGCDVVLHCNGDMDEMRAIAGAAVELAGRPAERAGHAMSMLVEPDDAHEETLREEFAELTAAAAV